MYVLNKPLCKCPHLKSRFTGKVGGRDMTYECNTKTGFSYPVSRLRQTCLSKLIYQRVRFLSRVVGELRIMGTMYTYFGILHNI